MDNRVLSEFSLQDGHEPNSMVPKLVPWKPDPIDPAQVIGKVILEWSPYCGTYGMGGPGFLGFRLRKGQPKWLIISIWGADEWVYACGRSLGGRPTERSRPWATQYAGMEKWDELTEKVVGRKIARLTVDQKSMELQLDTGFAMQIQPSARTRRPFRGGNLRSFSSDDDLRKGVFLAPTCAIWI